MFKAVWDSPWRTWEYKSLESYAEDGRIHIIGHVPVQRLYSIDWPDGIIPEMPSVYISKGGNVINIDLGCAIMPAEERPAGCALCCMNLSRYAKEEAGAFLYFS